MKNKLLLIITTIIIVVFPRLNYAQAPTMGTVSDFVLFSTIGSVSNTGLSHLTGNVGTNGGSNTGFGNVNGGMHAGDGVSAQCAADLLIAYNDLNATVATMFPGTLLGNGQILIPGIYQISAATTINQDLILDAQGIPSSVFIIRIQGSLSTNANSKVKLINGAQACNVYWQVEGMVSMATGTSMKGTIIANNAAINMSTGDTLEGRAMTTSGAITIDGVLAYTPIGCGSPFLTGPIPPPLVSVECYSIFSSIGPVTNVGVTYVTGDVGTNSGLTTGYNPLFVAGTIHPIPDGSTAAAAADLLNAYNLFALIPTDIELLFPAQFGNNLVLTPHKYEMNGAVTFTDTVYLDAQMNPNAVFVIHTFGAFSTSTYSKVILINGTQVENVYWIIDGAVEINDYSEFKGTIICNNGAMDINTGVILDGRALTTDGALNTSAIQVNMPLGCGVAFPPTVITQPSNQIACLGGSVSFSVSATGSGLTYQWRRGLINLVNGGNISGANSATLTINPVSFLDTASNYNVVVSGAVAPIVTSSNATLSVYTAPNITSGPISQIGCIGGSASFSVTTTGAGLSYQWRKGIVNLVNGGNISGATSATLTINPISIIDAGSDYNVIITGACLPNDTSSNVSLTVNTSPNITTGPTDQEGCLGGSVSFSVTSTGTGLTYQWRKGLVNLVNGGNISGATTATLTINPMAVSDTAFNYNVVVSGTCSPNTTSSNAALTIGSSAIITISPTTQTVCLGASASFSVTATGTGLTYQWRKGLVNLVDGGNISGATTATLTINPVSILDTAFNYNVVITGDCSPGTTSTNVALVFTPSPGITTAPLDQMGCEGSSVSFSVVATGTGLTYQWRKGLVNLVNGGNISGATSTMLTFNPVNMSDTASNYNVVVSGTCSPNATSANATLTVNPTPIVSLGPDNIIQPAPTATLNAGGGFSSYLWNTSDTTQTITVNTNGTFIVTVTDGFGCSNSDTIQVNFTNSIVNNDGSVSIISLYPNPTTGPVNLSIENLVTEDLVVNIIDMTGGVLINRYIGSVSGNLVQSFDFTDLTNGMYIIRMTANGKTSQMRFVISK